MPSNLLTPRVAATFANAIYDVNSGDERALKAFLGNAIFSANKPTEKKTLTASVGGRVFRAAEDGFGLAAMGAGQFEGDLFLIFRGTTTQNNKADFITDARIGITRSKTGYPVHIGFNHTFNSMLPEIREFVAANRVTGRVHCVGHSLGGAVATLAADWAFNNISNKVTLYTFGQPRVGLTFFAQKFSGKLTSDNIHRVYHTTDPVPMVPIFPYVHSPMPGLGHRLDSDQPILSGEAHKMKGYIDSVSGKNWDGLLRASPLFSHETVIEDWLKSRRNENPNCSKTFEWVERAILWFVAKFLSGLISVAQLAVMGVHTFMDKVAWLIAKGLELKDTVSDMAQLLIHKLMRILGIPKTRVGAKPGKNFLLFLLEALTKRAYELAQKAIRGL